MSRPIRRMTREIPEEAAKTLLQNEKRGVFAVNGDDGYPFCGSGQLFLRSIEHLTGKQVQEK